MCDKRWTIKNNIFSIQVFSQVLFILCTTKTFGRNFPKFCSNLQCDCNLLCSKLWCKSRSVSAWEPYCFERWISDDETTRIKFMQKVCCNGIPLVVGSCICYFSHVGVYCQTNENAAILEILSPENLPWKKFFHHIRPHTECATEDNVLDKKFVVASCGKLVADSEISFHSWNNTEKLYRFSLFPRAVGEKCRVELSTCFVHESRLIELFGSSTLNPTLGSSLITYCPIANLDSNLIHTFNYQFYLPRKDVSRNGKYILTQWHGTPDPNLLKDQRGCIARISDSDRHFLCTKGRCQKGQIFDGEGKKLKLHFQHGGYPPLAFELKNGFFVVVARSDERVFIPKGGCSTGKRNHLSSQNFTCRHHPRQQISSVIYHCERPTEADQLSRLNRCNEEAKTSTTFFALFPLNECRYEFQRHVLFELPFSEFQFDTWVKFEWKIIWSKYSFDETSLHKRRDPGVLLSNAWIRLQINENVVIDWVGPCGRNDKGRIPYFKAGVYNPSGNGYSIRYYLKNYKHTYKRPLDVATGLEKEKIKTLKVGDEPSQTFSNFNQLRMNLKFTKTSGTCTLRGL